MENEEGNEFGKQPRWRGRKLCPALGQAKFPFEVAPQAQGDQKLVQHLERREFEFIDDLAVAEHFLGTFSGQVEVLNRQMNKDTLESHCLGQADCTVLLRVPKREQPSPLARLQNYTRVLH